MKRSINNKGSTLEQPQDVIDESATEKKKNGSRKKGSIQKKGGIYYAVITVGAKRKWYKGAHTKKSAQIILNEKLYETR